MVVTGKLTQQEKSASHTIASPSARDHGLSKPQTTPQSLVSKGNTASRAIHPVWDRFVRLASPNFTVTELGLLSWDVVLGLVNHLGFRHSSTEVAEIRREWQRCADAAESTIRALHVVTDGKRTAEHVSPASQKRLLSNITTSSTAIDRGVVPTSSANNVTAPTQSSSVEGLAPSTEVVLPPAAKGPMSGRRSKTFPTPIKTRCIDDTKRVFEAWCAHFERGICFERFMRWMTAVGLFDRHFHQREAEHAFLGCLATTSVGSPASGSLDSGDIGDATGERRLLTYPIFRMRLLPELAGGLRCTVSELVKRLNNFGAPRVSTSRAKIHSPISQERSEAS